MAVLSACSERKSNCQHITRKAAIELAVAAKPTVERIRKQDWPMWASNEVRDVESNDGRGWGALVHFRGDGSNAPIAFIYEDCVVGWSEERVTG